jgi:hypothetical protein
MRRRRRSIACGIRMSGGADRTPDKANEEAVGQTSSTAPYSISAVKKIVDGGSVRQAEKRRCGGGGGSLDTRVALRRREGGAAAG